MAWEKFKYAETDTVLPAYIMVVDEYAQFVDDLDRKQQRLGDAFQGNIQKITRLGRSAHVHVVIATQSASSNLFPPSLKNNIAFRNICGRVEANISRMAIDSEEGESLPLTPGSYLGYSKGDTQQYQGWYTSENVILKLGTMKEGFDPETGLEIQEDEEEFDYFADLNNEDNEEFNENKDDEENVFNDEDNDDDDNNFLNKIRNNVFDEEESNENNDFEEILLDTEKDFSSEKEKQPNTFKIKTNPKIKIKVKNNTESKKEKSRGSIIIE